MNIEIKDTITLDGNQKYVVVSKTDYQDNTYYYLINKNDSSDILFCAENKNTGNSIIEVTDQKLIQTLLPLFIVAGKDVLAEASAKMKNKE